MYLKTLEILGFKSFADKTVFEFVQGVTGIVGPNGCGKSNVVDAIRWVLGETSAKALRGGEMADVIFNGTEKRKPLGMAEVTLTMADCEESLKVDFNEVAITRRVFRDGRSEYRLNGTLCRLRDIHDLFMDTGIGRTAYSIMAQGQIDQILSSKPEERRAVFEEAAGITKFKKEKKDALRKLEYTEANLLRVSDVLAEQDRRMNSLKRQVSKARRFQSFSADYRILDIHLLHQRYMELSEKRAEFTHSIRSLEVHDSHLIRILPEKEDRVDEARLAVRKFEAELSELRQQLNEHRNLLNSAEARIAFNNERKAELEIRTSQNYADIEITREKVAQQEFDFVTANQALDQINRRIIEQEIELRALEEKIASTTESRRALDSSLQSTRMQSNQTQTTIASMMAKKEAFIAQQEGTRDRKRHLSEEEQRLNLGIEEHIVQQTRIASEVSEMGFQLTELENGFQTIEHNYKEMRGELESARSAASESHRFLAQRSARLDAVKQLIASGEGFAKGTQILLKGLDDPELFAPSIEGVLASMIQVEVQFSRAIEAVLGENLQAVIVKDSLLAEILIQKLTEQKLGQASILPRNFIRHTEESKKALLPNGATAWAVDHVKYDPKIAPIIHQLLDRTLIVPNLRTAIQLRENDKTYRFVTLCGEILSPEGIIRGGISSSGQNSLLERQNEIRFLETEVAELHEANEMAKTKLALFETSLEEKRDAVELAREYLQKKKVDFSTLQGQLSLANREVENFTGRIDNLRWEQKELENRELVASVSGESLQSELSSMRERLEAMEEHGRNIQSQVDSIVNFERELSDSLNELRTRLAVEKRAKQAAEELQRPMEARLSELREITIRRETEIESFTQRIQASIEENEALKLRAENHRFEAEDLDVIISKKGLERGVILSTIEQAEAELSMVRQQLASTNEQKGREEIAATKVDLHLENLIETSESRHQIKLSSFEPDSDLFITTLHSRKVKNASGAEDLDPESEFVSVNPEEIGEVERKDFSNEINWSQIEGLVQDLKRKIESMGPVNLDAIEEYEELEERHYFLRDQHDDLISSKTELLSVIERINDETKRRFSETFAQVRINFQDMFKELFGDKAQADLTLVDEEDLLESGIEVIAKPPGKKLQSITLLSGGERSMTAVALLFSIYMIKPSPFCVLDELDAPLDESNIGRFVKVLDRFIDRSQFIIVTHSKRTMARADVMYGVTMEEFGVSKPVGMRLSSANDSKTIATSAAQKAALRLDA